MVRTALTQNHDAASSREFTENDSSETHNSLKTQPSRAPSPRPRKPYKMMPEARFHLHRADQTDPLFFSKMLDAHAQALQQLSADETSTSNSASDDNQDEEHSHYIVCRREAPAIQDREALWHQCGDAWSTLEEAAYLAHEEILRSADGEGIDFTAGNEFSLRQSGLEDGSKYFELVNEGIGTVEVVVLRIMGRKGALPVRNV